MIYPDTKRTIDFPVGDKTEQHASFTAGIALGVNRLVTVLLNAPTIDEVVAFTPEELLIICS